MPGILWVGTDDGNIQVSKDGGTTWTNISKNVPGIGETFHINRVEPSHFDPAVCYLAVDGHRLDDLKPYLFVTRDYGATWTSLVNNLPAWGTVNVVREDTKNKDLLFVGTEYGLYVSLNGGGQWRPMMSGMPTVRIDDIVIHPRDGDLIAGKPSIQQSVHRLLGLLDRGENPHSYWTIGIYGVVDHDGCPPEELCRRTAERGCQRKAASCVPICACHAARSDLPQNDRLARTLSVRCENHAFLSGQAMNRTRGSWLLRSQRG